VSDFEISTDREALDIALIHDYLSLHTDWARNIPYEIVARSIGHSLCFGGYRDGRQVAFARVITDYATFANLVDVFVLPDHRGRGYSKRMMQAVIAHPELQGLRRFTLATADAHRLYEQFGFASPGRPQNMMERYFPEIYAGQK
jgi:GNAT superfamily N-acetyltransferase